MKLNVVYLLSSLRMWSGGEKIFPQYHFISVYRNEWVAHRVNQNKAGQVLQHLILVQTQTGRSNTHTMLQHWPSTITQKLILSELFPILYFFFFLRTKMTISWESVFYVVLLYSIPLLLTGIQILLWNKKWGLMVIRKVAYMTVLPNPQNFFGKKVDSWGICVQWKLFLVFSLYCLHAVMTRLLNKKMQHLIDIKFWN